MSKDTIFKRLSYPVTMSEEQVLEAVVKKDIRNYLNKLKTSGVKIKHFHYGAKLGEAGVADRICCINGVFVAIEAKRPSKRNAKNGGMSDAQLTFRDDIVSSGGHYILAHSVDDVKVYLHDHFGLSSR